LSDAQHWKKDCKRIIAHFPLNGAPVLDGVDLLPEIEHECRYCGVMTTQPDCECYKVPAEDDVIKLADDLGFYDSTEDNKGNYATKAFVAGYNKARDRFKYTEEDMMRAIAFGVSVRDQGLHLDQFIYDKFIQKKKLPVAFEAELNPWSILEEPITQVNSKGVHVWVGNYIY
jgi:hypothetical protein